MYNNPNQNMYQNPAYGSQGDMNELNKWNWGAFVFGWVWGIGNKCYISLLQLIPIPLIGLIMSIIMGVNGTRWAFDNSDDRDLRSVLATQRTWNRAGLVLVIIYAVMILITLLAWGGLVACFGAMAREITYY